MLKLQLLFPTSKLIHWSEQYDYNAKLEPLITDQIKPNATRNGFLTKDEFLTVCEWKSPRNVPNCRENSEEMIQELTSIMLHTQNEQLRIEALTLLSGVNYPVASVFLHFLHRDKYPIIDFRALESLNVKKGVIKKYSFPFWMEYTNFCRKLSAKSHLDMRTIDRALWAYSKHNSLT